MFNSTDNGRLIGYLLLNPLCYVAELWTINIGSANVLIKNVKECGIVNAKTIEAIKLPFGMVSGVRPNIVY